MAAMMLNRHNGAYMLVTTGDRIGLSVYGKHSELSDVGAGHICRLSTFCR